MITLNFHFTLLFYEIQDWNSARRSSSEIPVSHRIHAVICFHVNSLPATQITHARFTGQRIKSNNKYTVRATVILISSETNSSLIGHTVTLQVLPSDTGCQFQNTWYGVSNRQRVINEGFLRAFHLPLPILISPLLDIHLSLPSMYAN
jgi:hypothetical protein